MTSNSSLGYIESAQTLLGAAGRQWSQAELLRAAEAGQLRNTGWPIGLVIQREGLSPTPTADGIEARLEYYRNTGSTWNDYWVFKRDGSYYVVRLFEENFEEPSYRSSRGHPERPLWFDMRLWRIAEVVLHSATIYGALGVSPSEPYLLAANHGGLDGRELATSDLRKYVGPGRICRVTQSRWQREVTQDLVTSTLKQIVYDISNELFMLFDFFDISRQAVNEIVDDFLRSRL